ncbi:MULTISPECIES: YlqF/YawG family GTPase [Aminobacterium]|jgi:ribosome biogenesis GTPase A|uniref:Ribosome biogenesis GTPase A n=1 Tax=Aminobacterium colombiense (strain DSM 12261 / ALA-1) TaxID=572547 RepID=D5EGG2_AMICL|nr:MULTISPECIES: GTPase [Aminobacterium]MDD2378510.1 50S ribosome-binding GTPase [Aminobacterium colombiense]ADE57644.1 ribosome biogenesis GTP-binding protein YlqF [Aminobacterium colombiense DSM 12261]MDD3768670.1 50S ribosome-binding GTPase [Aminobacterium colombiense]MDD4265055.1 50S ribosome-binding GTPase [Aminobacterium colombiense]MDD4586230.1 50S ribosome-binding GTPase [Aminobacterium colombiense]
MPRTVWYPGHMAKGKRKLEELVQKLDLILEVRDARAPHLTSSPMSDQLSRICPVYIVLSRADLAEEGATKAWLQFFSSIKQKAWAFNFLEGRIQLLRRDLAKLRPAHRELRLAVVGIPNVGKSLFLNLLVGKKRAPVGGVPGITRGVSWYKGQDILAVDSPGILDPRSHNEVHRRLAWLGCSKAEVIGGTDVVALSLIEHLKERGHWHLVEKKWNIENVEEEPLVTLEKIGHRLGCLVSGGRVDLLLAGQRFLDAFSTGKLGRITLEWPGERYPWEIE